MCPKCGSLLGNDVGGQGFNQPVQPMDQPNQQFFQQPVSEEPAKKSFITLQKADNSNNSGSNTKGKKKARKIILLIILVLILKWIFLPGAYSTVKKYNFWFEFGVAKPMLKYTEGEFKDELKDSLQDIMDSYDDYHVKINSIKIDGGKEKVTGSELKELQEAINEMSKSSKITKIYKYNTKINYSYGEEKNTYEGETYIYKKGLKWYVMPIDIVAFYMRLSMGIATECSFASCPKSCTDGICACTNDKMEKIYCEYNTNKLEDYDYNSSSSTSSSSSSNSYYKNLIDEVNDDVKCSSAICPGECEDGLCTCVYNNEGTEETIQCKISIE